MMSDCLSHSCPTCPECKGEGVLGGCGSPTCGHVHTFMFCPDCRGSGYPREAVERAAKALHNFVVGFVTIHEFSDPGFSLDDAREATLIAIRAFHNEGTE